MLRIYPVVLEVLKQLQPALKRIEVKDRDLARQLRRCSSSIALNLAEGMYSRGRNRNARYHSALGSARETLACLDLASSNQCSFKLLPQGEAERSAPRVRAQLGAQAGPTR
jgi:four helix bundle protein